VGTPHMLSTTEMISTCSWRPPTT